MSFKFGKAGCSDIKVEEFEPICTFEDIEGTTPLEVDVPAPRLSIPFPPPECVCFSFNPNLDSDEKKPIKSKPEEGNWVRVGIGPSNKYDCCDGKYDINTELNLYYCIPKLLTSEIEAKPLRIKHEGSGGASVYQPKFKVEYPRKDNGYCYDYKLINNDEPVEIEIPCVPGINVRSEAALTIEYKKSGSSTSEKYVPALSVSGGANCTPHTITLGNGTGGWGGGATVTDKIIIPCVPGIRMSNELTTPELEFEFEDASIPPIKYAPELGFDDEREECDDYTLNYKEQEKKTIKIPCVPGVSVKGAKTVTTSAGSTDSSKTGLPKLSIKVKQNNTSTSADKTYQPTITQSPRSNACSDYNFTVGGDDVEVEIPCVPDVSASDTPEDKKGKLKIKYKTNSGTTSTISTTVTTTVKVDRADPGGECDDYKISAATEIEEIDLSDIAGGGDGCNNKVAVKKDAEWKKLTIKNAAIQGSSGTTTFTPKVKVTESGTDCTEYTIEPDGEDKEICIPSLELTSAAGTDVTTKGTGGSGAYTYTTKFDLKYMKEKAPTSDSETESTETEYEETKKELDAITTVELSKADGCEPYKLSAYVKIPELDLTEIVGGVGCVPTLGIHGSGTKIATQTSTTTLKIKYGSASSSYVATQIQAELNLYESTSASADGCPDYGLQYKLPENIEINLSDAISGSSGGDKTVTVVTNVRYNTTNHILQKKTRQLTFKGALGDESDWTAFDGGQAVPES